MKWLPRQPGQKSAVPTLVKQGGIVRRSGSSYRDTWTPERAVNEALSRVTWVFRSIDAIGSNQAKIPLVFRRDDAQTGEEIANHPLYSMLNSRSNVGENSFAFRFRLSSQLLLSPKGVFVEIVRSQGTGQVLALVILPPEFTKPIPDRRLFVKGFEVAVPGEAPVTIKRENVMWIRKPHPMDPYGAITPLESAGLAIETDWLARLYNRNFMLNDGRPGGLVVVKGEMTEEDKEELRARFRGNVETAGRVSVIASEEGADWVDTAISPRDAQYIDARKLTKEEVLMAFGVPESVLANAAGRTFDNAEQERLIFWMETMSAHLELIARDFDILDDDPSSFAAFDTSGIDVIQRAEMRRREFLVKEWQEGLISQDEYRIETRRPVLPERGARLYIPKTRVPIATTDGEEIPDLAVLPAPAEGRPPGDSAEIPAVDDEEPQERTPPMLRAASAIGAGSQSVYSPEVTLRVVAGEKALPAAPPDPIVKVKVGSYTVLEEDLVSFKQSTVDSFERWEDLFEKMMVRFFARQKRVVIEKITGSKSRRAFRSLGPDVDPIAMKATVKQVFDVDTWNEQLTEDSQSVVKDIMNEFGKKLADQLGARWDDRDERLLAELTKHSARIRLINETTAKELTEARAASDTPDAFAEKAQEIFEDAIERRAPVVSTTQVVGAGNAGKLVALMQSAARIANEAGDPEEGVAFYKKVWVTVGDSRVRDAHQARDGDTVELQEAFGGDLDYPGDPSGSPEDTVGCRCTLSYTVNGELVL